MSKKKTLFLLISIIFLVLSAQEKVNLEESPSAFKIGEYLEYRAYYGFLNASQITFEIKADTINEIPVYHAKGYGKTTGLARFFFKVEDRYESYFRKEDNLPLRFIRDIDEGGYTKDIEISFDRKKQLALIHNKEKDTLFSRAIEKNALDLISCFYFLRNHPDINNIKEGESLELDMFFDAENFVFNLKFLGKEIIDTKFGKVECLKLRPYVQKGRVFKEEESISLWISNDLNRIPVRIQANLAVGSIKCDLDNFRNLKNPFLIHF